MISTIKTGARVLAKFVAANSSTILVWVAGFGVVGTAAAASKVTPKSQEILECKRKSESDISKDLKAGVITDEDVKEIKSNMYIRFAKDMTKTWAPVVLLGGLTIFSIIFAHKLDLKRQAALAAALTITEDRLRESERYRAAVKEMVGTKQEEAISAKVKEDYIREHPIDFNNIIDTGHGNTIMLDYASGRVFKASPEWVRQGINNLNERLLTEMWVDLNDFYSEIGLKTNGIGDIVGWNIDNGQIRLDPSSVLDENEVPVYVVDFQVRPMGSYKSY